MGRAFATIGTGAMAPVLCQALRTFVPYSQRHGYELRIGTGESQGRPTSWAKVLFLQELLTQYEEVLWVDSDIVILDPSEDLADRVGADAYQAFVEPRFEDRISVNAGVWLVRADERTDRFLQTVWDATEYIDSMWWENTAILELLGYNQDGRGPRRPTEWSEGTHMLPEEWNMLLWPNGLRKARFRHYANQPNDRREQWMRTDADRLNGDRSWIMGAGRRWAARHVPRSPSALAAKARRRTLMALRRPTV